MKIPTARWRILRLSLERNLCATQSVFYYPAGGDDWDALNEMHAMRGLQFRGLRRSRLRPDETVGRHSSSGRCDACYWLGGHGGVVVAQQTGSGIRVFAQSWNIWRAQQRSQLFTCRSFCRLSVGSVLEVDTYSEARRPLLFLDEAAHDPIASFWVCVLSCSSLQNIFISFRR